MSIKIINPASSGTVVTSSSVQNFIINGAFDYWQRVGPNNLIVPSGSTGYRADRWYIVNSLDVTSVNFYRLSGSLDGSKYLCNVDVNGSGNTTGNLELWQALDNQTTHSIYNQSVSFAINIKALNNVTQVGIQFAYATTEVQPTTFYGSEQLFTVNTGSYTLCKYENQAIGTSPTTSGVVGVRIRPTAVSSGDVFDASNGFQAEQAIMNIGATAAPFQRAGLVASEELQLCQRFYAKTGDVDSDPAVATATGAWNSDTSTLASTDYVNMNWTYPVPMRATPTITTINAVTAALGTWRNFNAGTDIAMSVPFATGNQSVTITNAASSSLGFLYGHIIADAEI